MKTKTIFFGLGALIVFGIFSFKKSVSNDDASVVLIGQLYNGDNQGFVITYGDDRKEIRPFKTKWKALNSETYVQIQIQANEILTEFKKKGYHIVCSHQFTQETLILEKN